MSVAAIVGSAFDRPELAGRPLEAVDVETRFGPARLHRYPTERGEAYLLFRHAVPHRYLPNQIPYRAHAAALREVGCDALLITSSCGVLDPDVPLDQPLLVSDLLMIDNRLPDGSACSMFPEPVEGQGHLVMDEGLFSADLSRQVEAIGADMGWTSAPRVIFAYAGGPRTKTAAENRALAATGAQVNSMTVGPEAVLAAELEIPVAAVVIGHKYSVAGGTDPVDRVSLAASLQRSKAAMERFVARFVECAEAPPFANRIYRF